MRNIQNITLSQKFTFGQWELTLRITMKIGLNLKDTGDYSQSDFQYIPSVIKRGMIHLLDVLKWDQEEEDSTATLYWLLFSGIPAYIGKIKMELDVKNV